MENKSSKYFKYAIGEIVLVVIGILIALQINSWNQNRQDRIQEQQILAQLLTEYQNNLNQLNQKIDIRNSMIQSCITILKYRQKSINLVNVDSFNLHMSRVITRPTYDPELGVTNELTNSGKLYLLKNAMLRNKISAFPSLLAEVREEEMVIFNNVEERLTPFIYEHYQMGSIITEILADNEFNNKHKLNTSELNFSISDLLKQDDISTLLYHPTLEDHLANMISNTDYTNEQSLGVTKKIEEIILLINKEIDQK